MEKRASISGRRVSSEGYCRTGLCESMVEVVFVVMFEVMFVVVFRSSFCGRRCGCCCCSPSMDFNGVPFVIGFAANSTAVVAELPAVRSWDLPAPDLSDSVASSDSSQRRNSPNSMSRCRDRQASETSVTARSDLSSRAATAVATEPSPISLQFCALSRLPVASDSIETFGRSSMPRHHPAHGLSLTATCATSPSLPTDIDFLAFPAALSNRLTKDGIFTF